MSITVDCAGDRHDGGASHIGDVATLAYARGRLDLATAMAVSGAAVSPPRGSETKPGLAVLVALLMVQEPGRSP